MRQHITDIQYRKMIGLFIVLFLGMLAFALAPGIAFAQDNDKATTEWQDLQGLLDKYDSGTIYLTKDYKATDSDTYLTLAEGKKLTIDLKGHTIDRNTPREDMCLEKGTLMFVYGELKIIDSKGGGKITGTDAYNGAFAVKGGSLTLEGGTITGNGAWDNAGGVVISGGGSFTLNGGTIENNYGEGVGGVYVAQGSFTMKKGKITNNTGYFHNGGVYISDGTFTMTGGEISGNKGRTCAAVLLGDSGDETAGVFDLRGGTVAGGEAAYLWGNEDVNTGSIEIQKGTFKLSGTPTVSSDGFADVYLAADQRISPAGNLNEALSLSVTTKEEPAEGAPVTITDGLKGRGDIFNFRSYKDYGVGENDSGEAVFGTPTYAITYKAGRGTGSDITKTGIKDYTYTLPDCMFTPPEGMKFTGWIFWSNPTIHQAGTTYKLNGNKRLTAQYDCITHDWTEPEYEWAEDNTSVTAKRTCNVGGETETETVNAAETVDDSTCEEKGLRTYTSESFSNSAFSVQTKTEDIDALGHDWGAWTVTKKANALTKGSKKRVCGNDPSHVQVKTIPATGVAGTLMVKMTASGSKNLNISWSKIKGAEGYDIFFARCNSNEKKIACKKIKTIKGNKTFSWTKTGLKKKTAYKVYVKAFASKDGKKTYIRTSPTMHAFTTGYDKKYTNAKAVTVTKTAISLKKGKTVAIKANVTKLKPKKKLMAKDHAPKLRYLSSEKKIAAVSGSGKITAKAKGTCTIYVYTHNGLSKSIKVTVK